MDPIEMAVLQNQYNYSLDEIYGLYEAKRTEGVNKVIEIKREIEHLQSSLSPDIKLEEKLQLEIAAISNRYNLPIPENEARPVKIEVKRIERQLIDHFTLNPEELYQLSPFSFEQFVGTLLEDMGMRVQLTPRTRDGGRDILAYYQSPFGELLIIVECKRYSPENKVSVNELRSFLFTVREQDRASCGLFATTSYFSKDAEKMAFDYKYQLKLKNFNDLKMWLGKYGSWSETSVGGFWLPN
jgi:restriction endonuclease Mrr